MKNHSRISMLKFIFVFLFIVLSMEVNGQYLWLDRSNNNSIAYEFLKPSFKNAEDMTFFTSAMFLSGRFVTSDKITIIGEIPFAIYGQDREQGENISENAFGNPYVGIEVKGENSPVFGEFGIRLPFAPSEDNQSAVMVGAFTEFVERLEAFIPEILPVNAFVNYYSVNKSALAIRLRGGFSGWFATGDRDENEWFLMYGVQGGYQTEQVNVMAGLSGRWWLSLEDADFAEKTFHQLILEADFGLGSVRPGVLIKVPLDDDLKEFVDLVWGISFLVNLDK